MSISSYFIPSGLTETEEVIKKSRFITLISHTPGRQAAQAFINDVRQQHPDARHHCWAFIAGTPNDSTQWGFSDDGEPSGTAGKPILARLQGSDIGELCAVVVRYSGGIKLGTGGLVRAYGGGVGQCLEQLKTHLKVPQTQGSIQCRYDQLSDLQHLLSRHSGTVIHTEYAEQLLVTSSLPSMALESFRQDLNNQFRGQLTLVTEDD